MSKLTKIYRKTIFWRAMRKFLKDPESAIKTENKVIFDLIYGWGNQRWSALDEYLICCLKHALECKGAILECGSGLTTILVGVIIQNSGNTIWSLEHSQAWGDRTKGYLHKYQINSACLCIKPLKDYGEFSWYDPPFDSMPDKFDMVICDGPPKVTKGGRYGLLPIMRKRLKPNSIILLDDAAREEEQTVSARWEKEFKTSYEIQGEKKPYIRITVPKLALDQ